MRLRAPRGPRTLCTSDGTSCAGTCDGVTRSVCAYPAATTECRPQSCSIGVVTLSSLCDGAGTCGALRTSNCGHYVCSGTSCKSSCATSADCTPGYGCLGGRCDPAFRVTVIVEGHGSVVCQDPVAVGSASLCQIVPEPGYVLAILTDTPAGQPPGNVLGLVDGKGTADPSDDTYTTAVLESDHTINASFRLGKGTTCVASSDCLTGYCVDGVCCDTACAGQCEACNVPASVGACVPVIGQPTGARTACASDGGVCAGACDGKNRTLCTNPGPDVVCRQPSCASGLAVLQATCQGTGACPAQQVQSCGQFVCGATLCLGNCTTDTDCGMGMYCSAGICVVRLPPGTTCASALQCASGFCADGVCCDQACTGQCQACDLAGLAGTCSTVSGTAPRAGRPACAGTGACMGLCDGTSAIACAMPGATTLCGQASCSNGSATTQGTCDGLGSCQGGQTRACGQYPCGATACKTACASELDCVTGATCTAGLCVPSSTMDAGAPPGEIDAAGADGGDTPDSAESSGFHVKGGGCKCNFGPETPGSLPAWLAALALGALLARRRRR